MSPDSAGFLETGDPEIQNIIALSQVHFQIAMSDILVDTPGREDGAWIEVL